MRRARLAACVAAIVAIGALAAWALLFPSPEPPSRGTPPGTPPVAPRDARRAPPATSSPVAPAPATRRRALLLRDGRPGPGELRARPEDGPRAEVRLVAGAAGELDLGALSPGWWRLAPLDPLDAIGASYGARADDDGDEWLAVLVPIEVDSTPAVSPARVRRVAPPAAPADVLQVRLASPVRIEGGRVVADETGLPIADARVELFADASDAPRWRERVGADGRFPAAPLARTELGRARLVAQAPGFAAASVRIEGAESVELRLRRGGLVLEGRLVDAAGRPAAGVVVARLIVRRERLDLTHETTADGRFRIEGIPAGAGDLGPRCARLDLHATAGAAGAELLRHVLTSDAAPLVLVVEPPAVLRVRVVDASGQGLAGSWGIAELLGQRGLGLGWRVAPLEWPAREGALVAASVHAPGHVPRRLVVRLPSEPVVVPLERGPESMRGVVVDERGAPVERVAVALTWSTPALADPTAQRGEVLLAAAPSDRQTVETGPDGAFVFEGLPAARWRIEVSPGVHEGATVEDVEPGAGPLRITVPDVQWVGGATMAFRPVAGESGEPLDAIVEVQTRQDGAWSRTSRGRRATWLRAGGRYTIRLRLGDRVSRPFEVDAAPGTKVDVGDVPLWLAGVVELHLVGWPTGPIERLRAAWSDPDGTPRAAEGTPAERWLLEGLTPGATQIVVEALPLAGPALRGTCAVLVSAGRTTEVSLDLGGD